MIKLKTLTMLLVGLGSLPVSADSTLKCNITGKDLNKSIVGHKWLGHGTHYSLKPYGGAYMIKHHGIKYSFESTFSTSNGKLYGSSVTIGSEGSQAKSDTTVTLKTEFTSWEGISLSCKLLK